MYNLSTQSPRTKTRFPKTGLRNCLLRALLPVPILLLAVTAVQAQAGDAADSLSPSALLRKLNEGLVQVYEKIAPAVVIIEIDKVTVEEDAPPGFGFDFFFRDQRKQKDLKRFHVPRPIPPSEGSGFIVREDGYIFTNYHVIADATAIKVKLKDGRHFKASLVGVDDMTDIAVIKIEAKDLPVVKLGDSETVKVGHLVCAIGTPYNLDYTFTTGIVSAIGRSNLYQAIYEEYIQTDAAINPGNSGGPLCDVEGNVIGMNTLINGINRGLGFAIPINMAKEVGLQLIATGRIVRPWLGIRIATLGENPDLAAHFEGIEKGVVVETIEENTPAYESDLRPADVITAVDGVPVERARQLQKEILKKRVGQSVELDVWRDGKAAKVRITTGELPSDLSQLASAKRKVVPTEERQSEIYGLTVQDLTPDLIERLGTDLESGVVVSQVAPGSPAETAGIQVDDIITELDSREVEDVAAFETILAKTDSRRSVLLLYVRGKEKTYAVLKAPGKEK